jgi:hypothetical protein
MTQCFLALFSLVSIALAGRALAQEVGQLPPPIAAFYQDRNFVSLFSTPADRLKVVAYAQLPEERQKQEPLSQRLGTLAPIMARVERHITDLDPHMILPLKGMAERYPGYNEIADIKEVRDFKNGLAVRVAACEVDPEGRAVLVSLYERAGGDERALPPVNERLRLGRGQTCRDQIHYWSEVAGEWVTQKTHAAFLDETAR